jgi:hypothetical protein
MLMPQTAPLVHIQPLPDGYQLASGEHAITQNRVTRNTFRTVQLTAWMPDNFADATTTGPGSDDEDFVDNYCKQCEHYFDEEELDRQDCSSLGLEDSNGNPIIAATATSCCPCYNCGLSDVDFPCAAGYADPDNADSEDTFSLSPMAFAIDVELKRDLAIVRRTSAWCQKVSDDGLAGSNFQAGNTYDDDTVCWGNDNDNPQTLSEAVATYTDAPGNNDLLSPAAFRDHRADTRRSSAVHPLPGQLVRAGYDALLVATAAEMPAAFLLLRGSGVPAEQGLIVIGLEAITHITDDGSSVPAYQTEPTAGGRRWLVINDPAALDDPSGDGLGLLLGQLPSSPEPCTSITPLSSELVAAAAS